MASSPFRFKGSYFSYVLVYFFYYFSMATFSSVLSVYLTGLGLSAGEMSFIVSAAGLFSLVVVPFNGYLSDRTGKPKVISSFLLVAVGVLGVVFAFCRSVWALFLLDGVIMSLINSVSNVCERMAGASEYRYGILRIWGTFGYAAGAQAAGLMMEFFSPSYIFLMLPFSTFLAILGFWGCGGVRNAPEKEGAKERGLLASILKNPHFLFYMVIALTFAGCNGVNMTYAPVLLTTLGVPASAMGTVLFFSTLSEIPIILFSNKFMDRFSGKTLLTAAFSVSIAQFLIYGFSRSSWVTVAAMILLKAVASTTFMMITLKIVRNLISPRFTTTGLSVVNAANNLSVIAMQNFGGFLTDRAGVHTLYLFVAGLSVLGLVLSLFLKVKNSEKVFS